jgi:hypothetical protein
MQTVGLSMANEILGTAAVKPERGTIVIIRLRLPASASADLSLSNSGPAGSPLRQMERNECRRTESSFRMPIVCDDIMGFIILPIPR